MALTDKTREAARALETAAREFAKHNGPGSGDIERSAFSGDLCVAAIRYTRAYHAEARELGLIPDYEVSRRCANDE